MMIRLFLMFSSFFVGFLAKSYGQLGLSGRVYELERDSLLVGVSVTVWRLGEERVFVGSTVTDRQGTYSFSSLLGEQFELSFTSLGYAEEKRLIRMGDEHGVMLDIGMRRVDEMLEPIVLEFQRPMVRKGDKVVFEASAFGRGDELVLADLLDRIPGIRVEKDGSVWVGFQEIEKIMVEGDDFFEKDYQVLSSNMPVYPIEKIEVLDHYKENRFEESLEKSQKKALNLVLKDDYRTGWFGEMAVGASPLGFKSRALKVDLMSFGGQHKYYAVAGNVVRAAGEELVLRARDDASEDLLTGTGLRFVELGGVEEGLVPTSRLRSGIQRGFSTSVATRPRKDLKLHLDISLGRTRVSANSMQFDRLNLRDSIFSRKENRVNSISELSGKGAFRVQFEPNQYSQLLSKSRFELQSDEEVLMLISNHVPLFGRGVYSGQLLGQEFNYSTRFSTTRVLRIDSRIIGEHAPQLFEYRETPVQELTKENNSQWINHKYVFFDWEANYSSVYQQNKLFEAGFAAVQWANEMEVERVVFLDELRFMENQRYSSFCAYLNYSMDLGSLYLKSLSSVYLMFGKLVWAPAFRGSVKIGNDFKLNWSYAHGVAPNRINDTHENYLMSGLRAAVKGLEKPGYSSRSTWVGNLQIGDWVSGFLWNNLLVFVRNHKQVSMAHWLDTERLVSDKIWVYNTFYFSAQSKLDLYLKPILTNLKAELNMERSTFENSLNSFELMPSFLNAYTARVELKSGLKGSLNFHVGGKLTQSVFRDSKQSSSQILDGFQFLDLDINLKSGWVFSLSQEWCFSTNGFSENTSACFFDFKFMYEFFKNRLTVHGVGKNLFDVKYLVKNKKDQLGDFSTSYGLIGRGLFLKFLIRI